MAINERLRYYRQNIVSKTPAEFSSLFGVSQNNYYAYENGNRGITVDLLVKLGEYGCDLNWLVAGIENPEQKNFVNNSQIGGTNNKQKIEQSSSDCKSCSLIETNKILTEQNKKLTDKLLEKI